MNTFAPGKYFVGDLCYHDTLGGSSWDEICNKLYTKGEGEHRLDSGIHIAIFHTKWGDGSYESNLGTIHGVDSGTIGCVRVPDSVECGQKDAYAIIEFRNHFSCHSEDGMLRFGHISIDTDPDIEDESYVEEDFYEGH